MECSASVWLYRVKSRGAQATARELIVDRVRRAARRVHPARRPASRCIGGVVLKSRVPARVVLVRRLVCGGVAGGPVPRPGAAQVPVVIGGCGGASLFGH